MMTLLEDCSPHTYSVDDPSTADDGLPPPPLPPPAPPPCAVDSNTDAPSLACSPTAHLSTETCAGCVVPPPAKPSKVISTVLVWGLPTDMRLREFQNLFLFCPGVEGIDLQQASENLDWLTEEMPESDQPTMTPDSPVGILKFRDPRYAAAVRDRLDGLPMHGNDAGVIEEAGSSSKNSGGAVLKAKLTKKNWKIPAVSRTYQTLMQRISPPTATTPLEPVESSFSGSGATWLQQEKSGADWNAVVTSVGTIGERRGSFSFRSNSTNMGMSATAASTPDSGTATPSTGSMYSFWNGQNSGFESALYHNLERQFAGNRRQQKETGSSAASIPHRAVPSVKALPSSFASPSCAAVQSQQHPRPVLSDQNNPPCNTLYVGNLPMNASEDELRTLFVQCPGYKRLSYRQKPNGPMCFVEFENCDYAAAAMSDLYGTLLSNSVKGGIRLSFSKNPLGVRPMHPLSVFERKQHSAALMTDLSYSNHYQHYSQVSSFSYGYSQLPPPQYQQEQLHESLYTTGGTFTQLGTSFPTFSAQTSLEPLRSEPTRSTTLSPLHLACASAFGHSV